ncbi:hypothetical protein KY347_06660 [Candidatus Woesearchaeota archaeon]|nr:hypothetical protein [Candidatus Woesearchaeota archaeon]
MGKKSFELHFLITIGFFIVLIYLGLVLRPYLIEKFNWGSIEEQEETVDEHVSTPENVRQARAALTLGWTIFVTMVILFIILKIITRIKNKEV